MFTEEDPVAAKMLSYNRANRAVAILCNHQRAAPKNFSKQMENIMAKVDTGNSFVIRSVMYRWCLVVNIYLLIGIVKLQYPGILYITVHALLTDCRQEESGEGGKETAEGCQGRIQV